MLLIITSLFFIHCPGSHQSKAKVKLNPSNNIDSDSKGIDSDIYQATASLKKPAEINLLLQDVMKNKVFFDYDKWVLTEEGRNTLSKVAYIIRKNPSQSIVNMTIDGHTDSFGTEDYNLALGERRAKAVMEYLMALGVPENQLKIRSFGEEFAINQNGNIAEQSSNRKAEFKSQVE